MSNGIVTVRKDFKRETRYGRPLIIPPGGERRASPYRRCTTYVGVLEDMFNLQRWEKRMVALGLADRADLLLAVAAHRDEKERLDDICNQAKEAAKASASATTGTALHALTDIVDDGGKLPALPPGPAASLRCFQEATAALKVIDIERKLVLDTHKVAGTADRIYELDGQRYIGDTKSGNIELGILKIAMQLAVYARSQTYDVDTGERGIHGCSTTRGIVMHMPATDDPAQAKCELHWIDLEAGWEAVRVARQVWDQRSLKFKDLTEPFTGPPPRPSLRLEKQATTDAAEARAHRVAALEAQIRACTDADMVRAVWESHQGEWDDHLTECAKAHIATLPVVA
jgi:hypothetical protein